MILIIIILITEIIGLVAVVYPAALEPTLVDIVVVNVVVPLDAVQMSCSADHHASRRHWEVEEVADRSSSLVEDAPKKSDCRSSPEQMNSRTAPISKACSPYSCARRNRDGNDREQHNSSELVFLVLFHLSRTREEVPLLCSNKERRS
jgi:hypothetical protein